MLVWVYVLKPLNSTLSVYLPGGRAATTYRPGLSVVTVCGTLRSDSVTVTVAPGTAPPLTSVTTPRTTAVYDDCAEATPETASAMQRKEMARKRFSMLLIAPPMRSGGRENYSLARISDLRCLAATRSTKRSRCGCWKFFGRFRVSDCTAQCKKQSGLRQADSCE